MSKTKVKKAVKNLVDTRRGFAPVGPSRPSKQMPTKRTITTVAPGVSEPTRDPRTLSMEEALAVLQLRYDEKLASLNEPGTGETLRSLMDKPIRLEGQLKAGARF